MAYLMGAILTDNACIWAANRPSLQLMRKHFKPDHRIWEYVGIEETVAD